MTRSALALFPLLMLAGCNEERGGLQRADTGNPDLSAVLVGVVDGCRVWRLRDQGNGSRTVYVSVCGSGGSKAEWTENCGKGCTRHDESLSPASNRSASR